MGENIGSDTEDFDHEGRMLESAEIRAWMKNEIKADHVEVRCQALKKGVLVKDFEYVTLKPDEEHLWSAEQIDLSPDRIICIIFWKIESADTTRGDECAQFTLIPQFEL
ncbi:hypothetical protein AXG93_3786s1020 [Marchantia polymorpha subsp. ruderalis]|uniref:Uncharacterized protein n=1 Tax=Marchantia polymorpha subsp. ruderalis TaxID=1480154 RepID=A0A176W0T4_MARPO|nr:hypothetical protein AXG93_3786s1020 [Marchantia polymorpha subsp. ruderalis]